MNTTTRIINNKLMENLKEQFDLGGYDVELTDDTILVLLDGTELFRAMRNSRQSNWLARFNNDFIKEVK